MNETQKQLYGIAIFEDEIVLSDYTGPGERSYIVTPAQLAGFVRSSTTVHAYPGLVWIKNDGQSESHLFTLPAATRTILYRPLRKGKKEGKGRLQEHRLQLPALVVRASINSGKINSICLWGMNTAVLKPDTRLYELPLPNLNGSSLCLGSTERAKGADVRAAVERTVFDTPFNHHNNTVGSEKILFPDYVRLYKGKAPLRTLKPLGLGRTLLEGRQ
jgi:hypothetical protein